jgi:hypothetical protein
MKNIGFITLFYIWTSTLVMGQEFSLSGLLSSAYDDPLVRNIFDQSDYLRSADLRTPNINEVELRSRSDDLNLSIDDVRFRLTFTNFGEIREGGRYNELLIRNYELEYQVRVHVALIHRYKLALEFLRIESESELVNARKLNIEDRIKVEKANVLKGTGNVAKVAELERDYSKLFIKESKLNNSMTILESQILSHYQYENDMSFPLDSIIQPEEIVDFVNSNQEAANPKLALKEQDLELGLQETELEIKEQNGNFGFVQAEYDVNPGKEITDNLGYQIGINIPITNPDKADIERSKLKNLKQQQSLDYMISEHRIQMEIIGKELTELNDQFNYLKEQYLTLKERNQSLKGEYLSFQSLLTMQENELQFEEALLEQKIDIYTAYMNWLDNSGIISSQPIKNYLYSNTPEIRN